MAWRHVEVGGQRLRFVQEVLAGVRSLSELCRAYGVSRPTGYLWLKRFEQSGVAGLCEHSRRPERSPRRSGVDLEERVVALRQRYPEWGARKLRVLLQAQGMDVPSSTLHRVLKRRGLVHPLDAHRPALGSFCRSEPNQLWQMDFKSPKGWNTPQGPLSVLDDHSRYALALQQLPSGRAEHVQEQLERVFAAAGVPEAMLMDHGAPWWNMRSSGGWTQLSVWLMRLDIRLYYSGICHPQTQGKVERFHRALEMARRRRGHPQTDPQLWLDCFRDEYNHVRPHEALDMKTPPVAGGPARGPLPARATRSIRPMPRCTGSTTADRCAWTGASGRSPAHWPGNMSGYSASARERWSSTRPPCCANSTLLGSKPSTSVKDVWRQTVKHVLELDS